MSSNSKSYNSPFTPWLMLAPAILMVSGFILYPAGNAIWLAFTSTNLLNISAQKFVGFDNFKNIFSDPNFPVALSHSFIWVIGCVSMQLIFGTLGALILNQKFKGRGFVRGLVLVPWATPSILVSLMWAWMLDPSLGIINSLLHRFHLQGLPFNWLGNPNTALPTLMTIDVWQGVPFFAVMILAALQGVSGEVIEAAKVDGANAWKTFWRVVLPIIAPAVAITTILRMIWTANYMDLILQLTNGGPINASLTMPLFSYQTGYKGFDFGKSAGIALIQALILATLVMVYVRQLRKSEKN